MVSPVSLLSPLPGSSIPSLSPLSPRVSPLLWSPPLVPMSLLDLCLQGLAVFGFILFGVLWLMHFMSIIYASVLAQEEVGGQRSDGRVSLLKPLKGYEVLLCVQDQDDPAVDVCKKLLGKYPNVDAVCSSPLAANVSTCWFSGGKKVGINPKINNLMPGYEGANEPDSLTDMTNQMTEKVGLVHGLPYVADRQGFAATLEQVYFGTSHPRSYISANVTGIKCVTGMSCLMRKDVLDQAGGLVAFAQYIAEDYFMAKAIADRGWKFSMATQVAMQNNSGSYSIGQFQSRMIRWDMMVFFMCHCLAWFISDYIQLTGPVLVVLQGGALCFSKLDFAVAWFIRESMAVQIFLSALWDPTISWRTGRYRLRCGGTAEEILDV
ncbi:hypothetical protein F7725_014852 [Dissostichus mawsoni]|uniref:ceramide glucosyltransferase n=1 Tax=Dissostichus mawsoni TaxID=36200 RepID=A0A7J5YG15_DISMA|nr:hypothetical protein F7725_014852 [Dissostichus mawsoni]